MNKPSLLMLVGLPGSGKSYYAELCHGYVVCSSDQIREKHFGDINDQTHNNEVFQILHREIVDNLKNGNDVIYDACNINSKRRMNFLKEIDKYPCIKRALVFAIPFSKCVARNGTRDRTIPIEVIERMYKNWQTPAPWEGFDFIDIERDTQPVFAPNIFDYIDYYQDNPHHRYTLGEHMINVWEYLNARTSDHALLEAGWYHDIGKPFCRTEDDNGIAHYYGHENVGAYDYLCVKTPRIENDALEIALLINYHMRLMHCENADNGMQLCSRYKKLWGEKFFDKLMLLHEADKSS